MPSGTSINVVTGEVTEVVVDIPVIPIAVVRRERCEIMLAEYESAVNADVIYSSVIYQSGKQTRENLVEAVSNYIAAANPLPISFTWRAADNSDVAFTSDDIKGLSAIIGLQKSDAIYRFQAKKDDIRDVNTGDDAADTITINAITWEN